LPNIRTEHNEAELVTQKSRTRPPDQPRTESGCDCLTWHRSLAMRIDLYADHHPAVRIASQWMGRKRLFSKQPVPLGILF
jgi:hypothetical protein